MGTNWIPFFFDSNRAFGEVPDLTAWEKLKARAKKGYDYDFKHILMDAWKCPDDSYTHPSDCVRGRPTRPPMPNFGWRSEHIGGVPTLAVWAKENGMYDQMFPADEFSQEGGK